MKKHFFLFVTGMLLGGVVISGGTPVRGRAAARVSLETDLMPSTALLHQSSQYYSANRAVLTKQYNLVGQVSRFNNDHLTVYVPSARLKPLVQTAMTTWNRALGQEVFSLGNATDHAITVTTKPSKAWDGLITGQIVYLNSTHLREASYVDQVANTPVTRKLKADYLVQKALYEHATGTAKQAAYTKGTHYFHDLLAIQKQAAPTYTAFWAGILTHEFGHALGLDHTPYLTDIMYAPASNESVSSPVAGKYPWTGPKDPNDTQRQSPSVSLRDVRRAELSQRLGYW